MCTLGLVASSSALGVTDTFEFRCRDEFSVCATNIEYTVECKVSMQKAQGHVKSFVVRRG
jgi:hypothetical protein